MSSKTGKSAGPVRPVHLRQPVPCPICKKPSKHKYHPFCSAHCANVDLNRWMTGQYGVPVVEEDETDSGQ